MELLLSFLRSGFYPLMSYCWVKIFLMYFRMALLIPNVLKPPVRTVTYCSSRKGKRKTVKAVIYRFLRLHSGLWLRRKVSLHTVTCLEKECEVRWNWSKIQLACSLTHLPHILAVAFTVLCLSPSFVGISSCKRIHMKKTCFRIHITKYSQWQKSVLQNRFISGLLHIWLI